MPDTITEENLVKMVTDNKAKKLIVKSSDSGKLKDASQAKSIVKGCKGKVDVETPETVSTACQTGAPAVSESLAELFALSLPARSLEITAWNNAEWALIPPVVSNAIQEARSGLQVVYDLLMSSNDRTRIALLEYQRITERLDSCCLEFGKRITALEMKLSSGCLRQDTILTDLKSQQNDLEQCRSSTREELDAHFKRTKLLIDTAIGKFNPCSNAELDAIALRLSENPTIQKLFQEARVREESMHVEALKLMTNRLNDLEDKLDWIRKTNEELSKIVASNEKQLEKYQARISVKLRLLDELPSRFTQIANLHTIINKVQADFEKHTSKDISDDLALIKNEISELRAIILHDPSPSRLNSAPLNSALNHPTENDYHKSMPPLIWKGTSINHEPRVSLNQDDFHQPQEQLSSEIRKSHPLLVPNQRDKMNVPARLSDPSYSTSLTGQDDLEFYQGQSRKSIERVNPQRYKQTMLIAEDQ